MLLNSLIDDNDFFMIKFLHINYLCIGTVFTSAFPILTSLTFPYLTALARQSGKWWVEIVWVEKKKRNHERGTFAFFSVLNGKYSMVYHLFFKIVNLVDFFFWSMQHSLRHLSSLTRDFRAEKMPRPNHWIPGEFPGT